MYRHIKVLLAKFQTLRKVIVHKLLMISFFNVIIMDSWIVIFTLGYNAVPLYFVAANCFRYGLCELLYFVPSVPFNMSPSFWDFFFLFFFFVCVYVIFLLYGTTRYLRAYAYFLSQSKSQSFLQGALVLFIGEFC